MLKIREQIPPTHTHTHRHTQNNTYVLQNLILHNRTELQSPLLCVRVFLMITQSPLAVDISLLHANACSISKVILTYTKQAAGSDRWALISAVPLFRRCTLQVIHASSAARPNTQHHSYLAWLRWKKYTVPIILNLYTGCVWVLP